MYPVDARYKAAVRSSHVRSSRAVLRDPTGSALLTLYPEGGGNVSLDTRRDVRRVCTDLSLAQDAPTLVPKTDDAPLSPLTDNEVALFQTVYVPSTGEGIEVPLGVFGFESADVDETRAGLTVSLKGLADRSRIVTRSRWRSPYSITPGTDLTTAVANALDYCWPGNPGLLSSVAVNIDTLTVFTEGGDSDPWKDLCALALALGCELFMDATGVPTLRPVPSPSSSSPDLEYLDTDRDGVLLVVNRSVSIAEGSYNGIIVTGESTGAITPVRAEWWDNDDPLVPPARPRPAFFTSPLIVTWAQANATAQRLLPQYLGAQEVITYEQVPNPAMDGWDLAHIERASSGVLADVVTDSVTYPLSPSGTQKVLGRGRRVWG